MSDDTLVPWQWSARARSAGTASGTAAYLPACLGRAFRLAVGETVI